MVGYGAVLWWGLATSFETKAAIAVPWLGELFYEPHARFVTLCWVAAILVAGRVGWAFVQRSLRHWNRDADFNREVERRGIQRSDWQKASPRDCVHFALNVCTSVVILVARRRLTPFPLLLALVALLCAVGVPRTSPTSTLQPNIRS